MACLARIVKHDPPLKFPQRVENVMVYFELERTHAVTKIRGSIKNIHLYLNFVFFGFKIAALIITVIIIRQFIRRRNMSVKSLQGRRTKIRYSY